MSGLVDQSLQAGYAYGLYQHRYEIDAFLHFVRCLMDRPKVVLEIGMHRGGSAVMFSTLATDMVIAVDLPDGPWGGIGYDSANHRDLELTKAYAHLGIVRGNSRDTSTINRVVELLDGRQVDVLFIDADHSYQGVEADFLNYRSFVRRGGIIAFHDIKMDAPVHVRDHVEVPYFWRDLKSRYKDFEGVVHEFILPEGEWGGIGAIVV